MDKYKKYEQKLNQYNESRNWIKNKDKIDSQDHKRYSLCNISFSAEYAGQECPGANNYHKSPSSFNSVFIKVIERQWEELSNKALAIMDIETKKALVDAKDEVKDIILNIESYEKDLDNSGS